jgi:hypothetical protein
LARSSTAGAAEILEWNAAVSQYEAIRAGSGRIGGPDPALASAEVASGRFAGVEAQQAAEAFVLDLSCRAVQRGRSGDADSLVRLLMVVAFPFICDVG